MDNVSPVDKFCVVHDSFGRCVFSTRAAAVVVAVERIVCSIYIIRMSVCHCGNEKSDFVDSYLMCCTSRVCCFRWFLFILRSPFYPLPFNSFICLSFSLFPRNERESMYMYRMYDHTNVWLYLLLYFVLPSCVCGRSGMRVSKCAQFPLGWA